MYHNERGIDRQRREDVTLPEEDNNRIAVQLREMRDHLAGELRSQAEQLQQLEEDLKQLRGEHERLEAEVWARLEALGASKLSTPPTPLEALLAAARDFFKSTSPKQVFDYLTEKASRLGVRAAVFEVRGGAAWVAAARGFEPQLSEPALRSLAVPLTVDTPFRRVLEGGGPVAGNAEVLKQNPNVLNRFQPVSNDSIPLLPLRSAGVVSAIVYADSDGSGGSLPESALELLVELAGAQLDRLAALGRRAKSAQATSGDQDAQPEFSPAAQPPGTLAGTVERGEENEGTAGGAFEPGPPTEFERSRVDEGERRAHLDARRLARLLVCEIELYNGAEVVEGRKSKDLYKRLRADIERSREILERRFGPVAGELSDYFHEELVRTLAGDDPSLLGADSPGPSM